MEGNDVKGYGGMGKGSRVRGASERGGEGREMGRRGRGPGASEFLVTRLVVTGVTDGRDMGHDVPRGVGG